MIHKSRGYHPRRMQWSWMAGDWILVAPMHRDAFVFWLFHGSQLPFLPSIKISDFIIYLTWWPSFLVMTHFHALFSKTNLLVVNWWPFSALLLRKHTPFMFKLMLLPVLCHCFLLKPCSVLATPEESFQIRCPLTRDVINQLIGQWNARSVGLSITWLSLSNMHLRKVRSS